MSALRNPLASLLSTALLVVALECAVVPVGARRYYHHDRRHNATNDNYKRALSENSVYGADSPAPLSTSCGQTLCAYSKNYPSLAIYSAIKRVHRFLISDNPQDFEKSKTMDPVVVRYFKSWEGELQRGVYNYNPSELTGCDHYLDVISPEEGYSASDERTYYVVNLKNGYRQRVQTAVCLYPGDVCNDDYTGSTCRQAYREEKLLALPVEQRFDIGDFRVRKFMVPNGCVCSKPTKV